MRGNNRGSRVNEDEPEKRTYRGCVRTGRETADLSTSLRFGRDDKSVELWACGPRDEKRLGPATTLYGTVALSFVIPPAPACRGSSRVAEASRKIK